MPTLADFQALIGGDDTAKAADAGRDLSNYFVVYNDEYNTLIQKRQEAQFAIIDASSDTDGVDHAIVLHLQSLVLGTESRMKVQDAKMMAFTASTLTINSPTDDQIKQVKDLTVKLAALKSRDDAIQAIMVALGDVAGVVNQIQTA